MTTESSSYDEVPHGNLAFPHSPGPVGDDRAHVRLVLSGRRAGRVLELGCASGGISSRWRSICRTATSWASICQKARRRGACHDARAGHAQHSHHPRSILDIDERWGRFDYIICHGVFSWVEPHVQDAILRIAADNLVRTASPTSATTPIPAGTCARWCGTAMRYHAGRFDGPQEQIDQARAPAEFSRLRLGSVRSAASFLSRDRRLNSDRLVLAHEHLERTNSPITFTSSSSGPNGRACSTSARPTSPTCLVRVRRSCGRHA